MHINQQASTLVALITFVATIFVSPQAQALALHKRKSTNSGQALEQHQYQTFHEQLANNPLLTNEIGLVPSSFTPKYKDDSIAYVPHANYETNDLNQRDQHHKLVGASSSDNGKASLQAINLSQSKMRLSEGATVAPPLADHQEEAPNCARVLQALQKQFVEQVIKQRVVDEDHLLMEKWLADNVNDLHRELKQTEMDFEHYVQVTKKILARNDVERNNNLLKRQLALQTALPLSIPLLAAPQEQGASGSHNWRHRSHLAELLLEGH